MTSTNLMAEQVGRRIGKAIARDILASEAATRDPETDQTQRMSRDWTGLDPQDIAKAVAAGLEPGSTEWDQMVTFAKSAFGEALSQGAR